MAVPKMLSKAEAATALCTDERTLDYWRAQGRGPDFVKMPKRICYTEAAITAFITARITEPMAIATV
jgi:hypothetical protein